MYHWRKMTEDDRRQILALRQARNLPWHSPPHLDFKVARQYIISSTCYNHSPVIGKNPQRMTECEAEVLRICGDYCSRVYAWCILPNHYHVLVKTESIKELRREIGSSMAGRPFNGTLRMIDAGAKSGITVSKGR